MGNFIKIVVVLLIGAAGVQNAVAHQSCVTTCVPDSTLCTTNCY